MPYYPGSSNPACAAAAQKLDGGATVGLAQAALANLGCFAFGNSILIPPAYGTLGPVSRNIFRDSGFKNWDFSISKSFTFKEGLRAQFRVGVFQHSQPSRFCQSLRRPERRLGGQRSLVWSGLRLRLRHDG